MGLRIYTGCGPPQSGGGLRDKGAQNFTPLTAKIDEILSPIPMTAKLAPNFVLSVCVMTDVLPSRSVSSSTLRRAVPIGPAISLALGSQFGPG